MISTGFFSTQENVDVNEHETKAISYISSQAIVLLLLLFILQSTICLNLSGIDHDVSNSVRACPYSIGMHEQLSWSAFNKYTLHLCYLTDAIILEVLLDKGKQNCIILQTKTSINNTQILTQTKLQIPKGNNCGRSRPDTRICEINR